MCMRANGKATTETAKVMKDTATEIYMKVISNEEKPTVKVFITGAMVKCMMVSGKMESRKDMVCGKGSLVTAT